MPSWPGARSAWASATGDVTRKVVLVEPLVDGSVLPSQNATSKGRSGRARASSSRSGAGREKAMSATYRQRLRDRPQVPVGLLAAQHADQALDDVLAVD